MYEYRARVLRVVDADTLHLEVDLGFDASQRMTVRLLGVNAPESPTKEGQEATRFVGRWLSTHAPSVIGLPVVMLNTTKDKREKYGRYLGSLSAGGHDLATDLLFEGHAAEYRP